MPRYSPVPMPQQGRVARLDRNTGVREVRLEDAAAGVRPCDDALSLAVTAELLGVSRTRVRRLILEGESLVNDATGIVAYRVAAAVAAGTIAFSPVVAGA